MFLEERINEARVFLKITQETLARRSSLDRSSAFCYYLYFTHRSIFDYSIFLIYVQLVRFLINSCNISRCN